MWANNMNHPLPLRLLLLLMLAAPLHAQVPADPQATIAALRQELANVQRDYQLLLTTCQAPKPPTFEEQLQAAKTAIDTVGLQAQNDVAFDAQQKRLEDQSFYVKDVTYAVTESNRIYVRYGWKVTVKNGIPRPQIFDVTVQFLNAAGFVVDTARQFNQGVPAQDEVTLTGDSLITYPSAFAVATVKAIITRRGR